jgi:hypothetical protein
MWSKTRRLGTITGVVSAQGDVVWGYSVVVVVVSKYVVVVLSHHPPLPSVRIF